VGPKYGTGFDVGQALLMESADFLLKELPVQLRLALTMRVILEALLERYTQHDGHLERSLKGRRILVLLDRDDGLTRDADSIGEFLLAVAPVCRARE
jgi:hypothetical protein